MFEIIFPASKVLLESLHPVSYAYDFNLLGFANPAIYL